MPYQKRWKVVSVFLENWHWTIVFHCIFVMTGLNFLLTFFFQEQFWIISGTEDYNLVGVCRGLFTAVKEKRVIGSQNILIRGLGITKR